MDIQWVGSDSNDLTVSILLDNGNVRVIRLLTEEFDYGDKELYYYTDVSELTTPQMGEVVMWLVECGCTVLEYDNTKEIAWEWGFDYD